MKPILFSLLALLLFTGARAQQNDAAAAETLSFKETEFNFGKIAQSKPVYHLFTVYNKSGKPVQIANVQASCGCTTPEWSRDAIAPGGKTDIKVGYNAAAEGPFEKTITVSYGDASQVLRIKGEVWKTPSTPAPGNAPVQFLNSRLQP
ncbi:DUF1573 domain-containing protein [Cnuella takakiae]|nr:DUF1573 domain-containing protein [Cnuella takakiae]OLY94924.1 hypothetical protein BUE76_17465 [Cnuella takakiae]